MPEFSRAQQVVADYIGVLQDHVDAADWPLSVDLLPHAKAEISSALEVAAESLADTHQLTEEVSEMLEFAYVALADYLTPDLVALLAEYRDAAAALEGTRRADLPNAPEWRTLEAASDLTGRVARESADEAAARRAHFRSLLLVRR